MDVERMPDPGATERSERIRQLEALGALTGGVAHDFANLLTVITGNLEIALDRLEPEARARRNVEAALQAVDDGSALTEQLVTLTRHKPVRPVDLDVHDLLQRCRPLLETSVGRACSVALASTASSCVAHADPTQLRAAILNLMVNARDAMPKGGRVEVRTGGIEPPGGGEPDRIAIEVIDAGTGMAPEVLANATKPFFTTKGPGRGTGLGLSTAADFAERSGGWLELASTPGEGTRAKLVLPSGDPARIEGRLRSLPRADRGGGAERLLVVEQESSVRELIAGYLRDLGYDVMEAVDDVTALSIADCSEAIDLVVVDVGHDGQLAGNELVHRLRTLCAPVAIVAMTADSRVRIAAADVPLIRKPFRLSDVAACVRATLGARAPS